MGAEDDLIDKGGRPTKYNEEYNDKVEKLCRLGATDKEIADFFDVCEATINNWKKSEPMFLESIKRGKMISDLDVNAALFKKATGYTVMVSRTFKVKRVEYEGGKRVRETEEIVTVPEEIFIPPDTTAQIFWSKNRRPKEWRDKQDIELSGEIKMPSIIIGK